MKGCQSRPSLSRVPEKGLEKVRADQDNPCYNRRREVPTFTTIGSGASPAPVVIPTPIPPVMLWVIVDIGAALINAVIVLIVRTRRTV